MSEVITTVQLYNPGGHRLPDGMEKLDRIDIQRSDKGKESIYGVVAIAGQERKLQLPDLAKVYGYDPEDRAKYNADPDKWQMGQDLRGLKEDMADLRAGMVELLDHNDRLAGQNASLEAQNDRLLREIGDLRQELQNAAEQRKREHEELIEWLRRAPPPPPANPRPTEATNQVITEEKEEKVVERQRSRTFGLAAGMLALGGVIGYLLAGRGHDRIIVFQEPKTPPAPQIEPAPANSLAGYHTDFFNPDKAYGVTAVELAPSLHLRGVPGEKYLVNQDGWIIVNKVGWDSQGKFDRQTMKIIRTNPRLKNVKLWAGYLGSRSKTIVQTG